MDYIPLSLQTTQYNQQAADLLRRVFPVWCADCAEEEISECLEEDRILLVAVEANEVVGLVGARPQYANTGWELHPLAVDERFRRHKIATRLCEKLEKILKTRGCITIYLGSDDEDGSTTLANTNLFEDTYEKIKNIKNLKNHAFEFYQSIGYIIVGVIPDANGLGKPDIWMAKSLVRGK